MLHRKGDASWDQNMKNLECHAKNLDLQAVRKDIVKANP